jgi:hypothetical protein
VSICSLLADLGWFYALACGGGRNNINEMLLSSDAVIFIEKKSLLLE